MTCPLCASTGPFINKPHEAWKAERFWHCTACDVVFIPPTEWASFEQEKKRYQNHQNDENSSGYLQFLEKTVIQILEKIPKSSRILDYGSGPRATLSMNLREKGYDVVSYDPFFNPIPVSGKFDLVLAHEVFEHFREPAKELQKIQSYLKANGIFLIHSSLRPSDEKFASWWYARDLTHVLLSSEKTLQWIARNYFWELKFWSPELWAFNKNSDL